MLIDTHAHINFKAFKDDAEKVLKRALENDTWVINIGSQYSTSKRAVEYAQKFEQGVYAVVGLHPVQLHDLEVMLENNLSFKSRKEDFDYNKYKELALNKKVVAIGETGLDYCDINKINLDSEIVKEKQREVFRKQLDLACELNLPVVIHCREAEEDLILLIDEQTEKINQCGGVVHCFMGDQKAARFYLKNNLHISFTCMITDDNKWDNIIKEIPFDKLLVETDSPYLTPKHLKGERNEPINVKYVIEKIAEIKGVEFEKVAEITFQNAVNLFKLK